MKATGRSCVVALDVDGTLFDGTSVDPAAVQAIDRATAAGHVVLIVTGRPWLDLPGIVPAVLGHCTAVVCEHGTELVDPSDGSRVALGERFPAPVWAELVALGAEATVEGTTTIGLPIAHLERATAITEQDGSGAYVVANKDSLAVVPIGVDKGTGLRRAIEALDLAGRTVIAIGDAVNDLPMFAVADIPVAVANAEPSLLASGIETTRSAFGAGVAEALARHLFGDPVR